MRKSQEIMLGNNAFLQICFDEDGRRYFNIKRKKPVDAVVCIDGINVHVRGEFRIVYREGNSKFGDEIYFQVWINEQDKEYTANSPYANIEYYMPKEDALEMMDIAFRYINSIKGGIK